MVSLKEIMNSNIEKPFYKGIAQESYELTQRLIQVEFKDSTERNKLLTDAKHSLSRLIDMQKDPFLNLSDCEKIALNYATNNFKLITDILSVE